MDLIPNVYSQNPPQMKVLNSLCAGLTLAGLSCLFGPEAHAQLTGLHVEPVITHDGVVGSSDLTGHTTYRVYATLTSPEDLVQAVFGSADSPLEIATTTSFWQTPGISEEFGTQINPAFIALFPELAYDSWMTIGLATIPTQGPEGSEQIGSIGMNTELGIFEAGGNFLLNSEVGGSFYALPGATNGIAGDDLEVLLGQFTTDGLLSGTLNLQVFVGGLSVNAQLATESFEAGLPGCTDPEACNYEPAAELDNGSCNVPEPGRDCDGNCLEDADGDNVCDADEVAGCQDEAACNFNPAATDSASGSCIYPEPLLDCNGECLADADNDGICDANEVPGCTVGAACNYDAAATDNNGSCIFPVAGYDCDGVCLADADNDGICDEFEVAGCTNELAVNFDETATDEDGSCVVDGSGFCGYGTTWDAATATCVWDEVTGACSDCPADFTDDGVISIADLLEWLPFYGLTCE